MDREKPAITELIPRYCYAIGSRDDYRGRANTFPVAGRQTST